MPNYGLIGRNLAHSFSQRYFEQKFKALGLQGYSYSLFEMDSLQGLKELLLQHLIDGFNVTIPFKETIIPLLDSIDPVAAEIGAVNTVEVSRLTNGNLRLHGRNTDAPAFQETLQPLLMPWHTHALILGTGGASKAVAWALQQLGISYHWVSRHPHGENQIGYPAAYSKAASYFLIVNTTPVGMFPHTDKTPWEHPELLTEKHLCYDLIYNPAPTLFLQQAARQGATVRDGLTMLHRQADLAFPLPQQ